MLPTKEYLNFNSTYLNGGYYNPSDSAYPETIKIHNSEERIKTEIKKYLNAPEHSQVLFISGATEGIASCMFWVKNYNPYGVVIGSRLDHDSIKLNAENMELIYKTVDIDKDNIELPENTSALFITHVCPRTGEIYPIEKLKQQKYNSDDYSDEELENNTQYRPLIFADVTQSIGKIPINMKQMKCNALFFSLHKISGDYNAGVLVINDSDNNRFKPLIAGHQQNNMRGGTYNVYSYFDFVKLINAYDYDRISCKEAWEKIVKKMEEAKIDVIKPVLNHTYNTVLIHRDKCSLGLINELAREGIYIGSSTACSTNTNDFNIRISFLNGDDVKNKTIDKIIGVIKKYDEEE